MGFAQGTRQLGRLLLKPAKAATRSLDLAGRLKRLERKVDLIEHFSHGSRGTYVGNNRVLVKAVVANKTIAYLVEADDKLLSPWFIVTGSYETELTDFFVRELRPDSRRIDVGANFGYFACLTARLCPEGRVVAVEADRHVFELARDNIAINGFDGRARAVHAAAKDDETPLTLYRRRTRSGNTSIHSHDPVWIERIGEPPAERFDVPGVRLDGLLDELGGRVDFIEIDVEGAEPLVLRGAERIIADNPALVIIMKWSPGQLRTAGFDLADFIAEIERRGLSAHELVRGGPVPLSRGGLLNRDYCAGIALKRI